MIVIRVQQRGLFAGQFAVCNGDLCYSIGDWFRGFLIKNHGVVKHFDGPVRRHNFETVMEPIPVRHYEFVMERCALWPVPHRVILECCGKTVDTLLTEREWELGYLTLKILPYSSESHKWFRIGVNGLKPGIPDAVKSRVKEFLT